MAFDCRIIGEGPLEPALAAAIEGADLRGHVELTGPRPISEVMAMLRGARVFALPCVEEADGGMDNLPTVIAEAMAAGLPVVSTTLAGVPEMVFRLTGYLVPPRSPDKLADALERLLTRPFLARQMGFVGCVEAKRRFNVRRTVRQFKRLLLEQTPVNIEPDAMRQDIYLRWLDWQRRRKAKAQAAVARSLAQPR